MERKSRRGLSFGAVALFAIIVVGTVAAGAYLYGVASPSAAASSTVSSTSSSTGFANVTSSMVSAHTTSSHNGTITVTSTGSSGSFILIGSGGTPSVLFGATQVGNVTRPVPAYTLVWTSWKLNTTMTIGQVEADVLVTPSSVNSTITIAVYIDGSLASNASDYTYAIAPNYGALNEPANMAIFAGIPANRTQPAGTVISLAVLSTATVYPHFNIGTVPTYEATLSPGSGMPTELPSPTSTVSSTVEIWAVS
jgi:hypothetical protein